MPLRCNPNPNGTLFLLNKPLHVTRKVRYSQTVRLAVILSLTSGVLCRLRVTVAVDNHKYSMRVTEGPKGSNPFNSRESKEGLEPAAAAAGAGAGGAGGRSVYC